MTNQIDFEELDQPKLPSILNVLTILSIIGSILGLIGGVYNFVTAEEGYKKMLEAQSKMQDAPAFVKKMMGPEMLETLRKTAENKVPLLVLTLIGSALCLYGAIEMRKLKKQGYMLWMVGEILPLVGSVVFIGFGMFSGFGIGGLIFPLLFIALYTVNRKYLVY